MSPFIYPPQPAEAPRHLAPIRPPPPSLGEEDTKALGLPLGLSKRPVPDGDLDVSVDLGEAVARTPALTPRATSRPSSPMPLDYLSLARGAPVVGARQPGEWKTRHFSQFMLHVLIVVFHLFSFFKCLCVDRCCRDRTNDFRTTPWAFVAPSCDSEEPQRACGTPETAHHYGRAEGEKAKKGEKDETRRDRRNFFVGCWYGTVRQHRLGISTWIGPVRATLELRVCLSVARSPQMPTVALLIYPTRNFSL